MKNILIYTLAFAIGVGASYLYADWRAEQKRAGEPCKPMDAKIES